MAKVNQRGVNVGDTTLLLLVGGGLAVAYFGVIKPIKDAAAAAMEKLGLKDDQLDKAQAKAMEKSNKANGWNPNYYKSVSGKHTVINKQTTADAYAKVLYGARRNSLTAGGMNDDEEAVYGVLRKMASQEQLSQLSDRFYVLYKKDLLGYLKSFLSSEEHFWATNEMAMVASIVVPLPNYIEYKPTTKTK